MLEKTPKCVNQNQAASQHLKTKKLGNLYRQPTKAVDEIECCRQREGGKVMEDNPDDDVRQLSLL